MPKRSTRRAVIGAEVPEPQNGDEVNRRLAALTDVASTVSRSLDLDITLNRALDKVMALAHADVGGILLYHERSRTLSYRVYRGLSEEFIRRIGRINLGEGIAGKAAELRTPIISDDISRDPRITRPLPGIEAFKAFMSIPLVARGRLLGVMNISTRNARGFPPEAVSLVSSISDQVAVAIENAQLYEALKRKEKARGDLLRKLISIQEEERKRIARGLHDEISQSLTGLAFNLEAVLAALPPETHETRERLEEIKSLSLRMLEEIHRVIYQLRPSLLDDLGLVAAVQWLADNYLEEAGIRVIFQTAGEERTLAPEAQIALFRIAQEAITNIVRHSGAESVRISVEFKKRSAAIHIEDDGKGFNVEEIMASRETDRGLGLLGMKERAELLEGRLTVDSSPGRGTRIDVEIPG